MHTVESLLGERASGSAPQERLHDALHALEHVEREQRFLAEAGEALASSLDYRDTLNTVAHLAAGTISDFCVVEIVGEDGRFVPIASEDVDDRQCEELCATVDSTLPQDAPAPILEAMQTNSVIVMPSIPAHDHHPFYHALHVIGAASVIIAPMVARGRALGVILLASRASHRPYTDADKVLAEELSRRAAVAVDNARLYEQAQRALRARDEMLSVVAHDLRNPLNIVSMTAELLEELIPEMPRTIRSGIERIRRSTEQMNRLIQDLLDVSKIDAGRLHLELAPVDPAEVFKEAVYMLRPLVERQSLTLETRSDAGFPEIDADRPRLLQAIGNLVGNAIKFTPAGGTVTMALECGESAVRFNVSDTGKGIAAENIPHLFDRFWQERPADARGIGLGLAIVKGIVDGHGGSVLVESTIGKGTTFTLQIPVRAAS